MFYSKNIKILFYVIKDKTFNINLFNYIRSPICKFKMIYK